MTTQKCVNGFYGEYGGSFVPEALQKELNSIYENFIKIKDDPEFNRELSDLYKKYVGRPSPIYFAKNLSNKIGGASIFLKREDLNHTGAHKINHTLGEVLLAKKMGKKKVIAETGAGQHGVALATAATLMGLECDIYMGTVDIEKESPNVARMKLLGARVIPVEGGNKTLKDAVDAAIGAYINDPITQFYAIGSVVGPHPFPEIVRHFQTIVGIEAKKQFNETYGCSPNALVACVGGGSNSIGLFSAFLDDNDVKIYGVEPSGKSLNYGEHAATLTLGKQGTIHGFKCYLLQDKDGTPSKIHTVASGLDYPGVGPEHCYLKDTGRIDYKTISDLEAVSAFFELSRTEGIIPALESAHAVAYAMKIAKEHNSDYKILVNLSGRGDKDIDFVMKNYKRPIN